MLLCRYHEIGVTEDAELHVPLIRRLLPCLGAWVLGQYVGKWVVP